VKTAPPPNCTAFPDGKTGACIGGGPISSNILVDEPTDLFATPPLPDPLPPLAEPPPELLAEPPDDPLPDDPPPEPLAPADLLGVIIFSFPAESVTFKATVPSNFLESVFRPNHKPKAITRIATTIITARMIFCLRSIMYIHCVKKYNIFYKYIYFE
jgi:hypothetical protein